MPTAEPDLRRLARSIGMRAEGADGLLERWRATRREVRGLHEELFYRPLLPATAQLSTAEASLAPEAAKARLAAIGYTDPAGAMRHIAALTEGVSRRAVDPAAAAPGDARLVRGRRRPRRRACWRSGGCPTSWAPRTGTSSCSGTRARRPAGSRRCCRRRRYVADALTRSPESVTWLADDADLVPRTFERLTAEADAILTRSDEPVTAVTALRGLRRRELARTAAADVAGRRHR